MLRLSPSLSPVDVPGLVSCAHGHTLQGLLLRLPCMPCAAEAAALRDELAAPREITTRIKPCRAAYSGLPCMPCAVEAAALREELAALREAAGCNEAAILREELAGLRAELLRLADENRRLQSTPKARRRKLHLNQAPINCLFTARPGP